MKIAIGKIQVTQLDYEANFKQIKQAILSAKQDNYEMIIFSELCLSSMMILHKFNDKQYIDSLIKMNEEIKDLSKDIIIVYGNLAKVNNQLVNAIYVCKDNAWCTNYLNHDFVTYKKSFNKLSLNDDYNYLINQIDEKINEIITINNQTFNFSVSDDYLINHSICDYHINLNNHNYINKQESIYFNDIKTNCFISVNMLGICTSGKVVKVFDGITYITSNGLLQGCLNTDFKQEIVNVETINQVIENEYELLDVLVYAIKAFDEKNFNVKMKWIIGLSGGLDSTINAALLSMAVGSDRIVGYNMATNYNSKTSINNALRLSNALGIKIVNGSIEDLNQSTINTINNYGYNDEYQSLVYENIQARLRGHLLSTFASIENGVVINNGNKVEVALGYCTLYGDAIGAVAPIGDLLKTDLFEIGKMINDKYQKEVINYNLLPQIINDKIVWDFAPSAELKDNQLDPMKWFYHDFLIDTFYNNKAYSVEDFMQDYLNDTLHDDIKKWVVYYGLQDPKLFINDLGWLINTMHNNSFKRVQTPPIICISENCFGDISEAPLRFIESNRFKLLKNQILNKI